MTKQPVQLPIPREVPRGISFGTYQEQLFRATREFVADVKRAEKEARDEAVQIRAKLGIPAEYRPDVHVERYSMAVQVFAALTAEATIDMYAVVRFGEEAVRKTWKRNQRGGMAGKLGEMLQAAGVSRESSAELLQVTSRIFKARNAFVHPKSDETVFDEKGNPVRTRGENVFPEVDEKAAQASYDDLLRFFKLLHQLQPDLGAMIHPW
jgi:hypothetical protein